MSVHVAMDEWMTRYHGRRERCALVNVDGVEVRIKMGPTTACAQSVEKSRQLLARVAEQLGFPAETLEAHATALTTHCRSLTGFKDRPKRDVPRQRVRPRSVYV
jgi:hypothetical protein